MSPFAASTTLCMLFSCLMVWNKSFAIVGGRGGEVLLTTHHSVGILYSFKASEFTGRVWGGVYLSHGMVYF